MPDGFQGENQAFYFFVIFLKRIYHFARLSLKGTLGIFHSARLSLKGSLGIFHSARPSLKGSLGIIHSARPSPPSEGLGEVGPLLICFSRMLISTASIVVKSTRKMKNVSCTEPELMSETAAHVGSMS